MAVRKNLTLDDSSPYDALPTGTVLRDRYVVGKLLGSGGFGMTYLAYDKERERAVAVKEFFPAGTAVRTDDNLTVEPMSSFRRDDFEKGLERFRGETEIILRFEGCSDILGLYDVFSQNGTAYYAMEYLSGISLKEYVREKGCLTEGQAVHAAERLLTALSAIHGGGVLHRDISPDNIILCGGGGVKLIDFGSARETDGQSMSVILKEGYAPLEQYQRRGAQSGRTDLYSLAMCLYFGLTGQEPDNPIDRLDDDSPFRAGLEKIPPALGAVIAKAAALRTADRFENAEEMLSAIRNTGISPEPADIKGNPPPDVPLPERVSPWRRLTVAVSAGISDLAASVRRLRGTGDITVKIGEESFPVSSTELDLRDKQLTNDRIANLRHMKNLRRLDLGDNFITDLSCLNGLDKMEYLYFPNNRVANIDFVRSMPRLKEINADNCVVADISPLAGISGLTLVNFGDNPVTDISPLAGCRELVSVKFDEARLGGAEALAGMEKLEMASFSGCGLRSIAPLADCARLRLAYFGRNDLIDLSPLAGKALEELYIDNNRRLAGHIGSFSGITVNGNVHMEKCGFSWEELYTLRDVLRGVFTMYADMGGKIITLGAEGSKV